MVVIRFPFRKTIKTDAVTRSHVLSLEGQERKPDYSTRSRTGAHGEDCFEIGPHDIVHIVTYTRSNSGRESIQVFLREGSKLQPEKLLAKQYTRTIRDFLDNTYPSWKFLV